MNNVVAKKAEVCSKLGPELTEAILKTSMGNPEVLDEVRDFYRKHPAHLKSGLASFDAVTNGGLQNWVSLVSGISDIDTKSLMMQIAITYSKVGVPVLYVTTNREYNLLKMYSCASYNMGAYDKFIPVSTLEALLSSGKEIPNNSEMLSEVGAIYFMDRVKDAEGDYFSFVESIEAFVMAIVNKFEKPPVVIVEDLNWLGRTCDIVDVDAVDEDGESIYDANDGVLRAYSGLKDISRKYNCRVLANYTLSSDVKVGQEVSLCNMDYPEELDSMSGCVLGVEVEISKENLDNFASGNNYNVKVRNLADKFGGYVEEVIEYNVDNKLFVL